MLDDIIIPQDLPDVPVMCMSNEGGLDTRPRVTADISHPHGVVDLLNPPKGTAGTKLTFNNLIEVMRAFEIVPVQLGMDWSFIPWSECRKLFEGLLDKYLYDQFNIIATDNGGDDVEN